MTTNCYWAPLETVVEHHHELSLSDIEHHYKLLVSTIRNCQWASLQSVTELYYKLLLSTIGNCCWASLRNVIERYWAWLQSVTERYWAPLGTVVEQHCKAILSMITNCYWAILGPVTKLLLSTIATPLSVKPPATSRTDASTLAYKFTGGVTMVGDDMEILGTCGVFFPPSAHYDRP